MSQDIKSIMSLEVPFVVVLGERPVMIDDIREWIPGSIIELGKEADEDLEVRINNKPMGQGSAIKMGENFGIQINYIGEPADRINALGPDNSAGSDDSNAEDLAMALLEGQI